MRQAIFHFLARHFAVAGVLIGLASNSAAGQDVHVPQSALSLCNSLAVLSRETVTPGTAISASPDGRWLVKYVHTPQGLELRLLDRDSGQARRLGLNPPPVPPGVVWKATGVAFSRGGELFLLESIGGLWVIDSSSATVRFPIFRDSHGLYPGAATIAGGLLAASFWPPESYFADAPSPGEVEIRFFNLQDGKRVRTRILKLDTAEAWTRMALSPDARRLAILLRPTRWPGKSDLRVLEVESNKILWRRKISGEDMAWSADGAKLLVLGGQLRWLDAATGKQRRTSVGNVRGSESQLLRLSEDAKLAVGSLARYNPLLRGLRAHDRRDAQLLLWRLDTGAILCDQLLRPSQSADVWPTGRGELIALEEKYDVRPPLRLLQDSTLVVYKWERSRTPSQ